RFAVITAGHCVCPDHVDSRLVQRFFTSSVVPALLALVPALVVWWRGRGLRRHLDDPALSERLLAGRRVHGLASGFTITLLVLAYSHTLAWTLPLLFIARMVAAYPARRLLFQETWSVRSYLSFFLRLIVAVLGYWILLALTPELIHVAGAHPRSVAIVLGLTLAAWNLRYADVLTRVMRARLIDDPELMPRFARLVESSGIKPPRFERVEVNGGVFANAVALPSLRQSAVVFTDTLLTRLHQGEVAAIAAHEIAHLEQFNVQRLRLAAVVGYAFVAIAVLVPTLGVNLPPLPGLLRFAWPALLFVSLIANARRRQRFETAADLRAVAL